MRFSDLADNLRRLLKRREHFRGLFPPQPDVLGLGEQRADLVGLVERGDEGRLKLVFDVVYEEMHYGLRYGVLDALAHDVKVRFD